MRLLPRRLIVWGITFCATACLVGTIAQPASAGINIFKEPCKTGGSSPLCSSNGSDNISGTNGIVLRAASVLSIVAGVTAVIMIMLAGFLFITAAGDTGKITSARNTLTYAIVGLIVIVLARAIVIFIVTRV